MLNRTRSHITTLIVVVVMVVGALPLSSAFAAEGTVGPALATDQQLQQPIVIVNTSFLNVRSGPGAIYSSIGVLPGGTELAVVGRTRDSSWWQVASAFGIGWVSAEFVLLRGDARAVPVVSAPGVVEQPRAAVVGAPVNVYVLPDGNASLLGMALVGSELPIAGQTGDGVWWQVETNVGMGWVLQAEVALRGSATVVPVVTVQTSLQPPVLVPVVPAASSVTTTTTTGAIPAGIGTNRPVIYVYHGQVRVTSSPYDQADEVHWFETGDRSEVFQYSEDGRWVLVSYLFNQMGWVKLEDVAISDPTDPRTQVWFNGPGILTLRDSPSNSGLTMALISEKQRLSVVNVTGDGRWFQLEHGTGVGWARADDVEIMTHPAGAQVPASTGLVGTTPVSPQLSGSLIQPAGAAIFNVPQPEPVRNYVVVNTGALNVRSGPGSGYTVVITVNGGTELDINASTPDGAWFRVVGPFGSGWVNAEFVIFRGDFDNVSIIRYADAIGTTGLPTAIVSAPINVYLGAGVETGLLGTAPAGLNLPVIGRSLDGSWLQVQTQSGPGWVLSSTITFRGDASLVPIVR